MICHVPTLKLAKPEDRDIVRWILEDESVRYTFGELTVARETWLESFDKLPVFLFPGGFIAAEIRADWAIYLHVAALPGSRGRVMNDAMTELLVWLFANTPAKHVSGWIHKDNRPAQMWCSMMGAKKRQRRGDKILYRLTRGEYAKAGV